MAFRKRKRARIEVDNDSIGTTSEDSAGSSSKKRTVTRKTVEGWISQYDKEFHTMRWLDFSMAGDRKHVAQVRCKVCCEFSERLISLRNYRPTFIEGTDNVRSSAVVDHAKSAMHARAMDLYRIKTQAPSPIDYAPIARAFVRDMLDPVAKERLVKKFEIAFFIAKEKFPFTKFFPLCKMEEKHGVKIGSGYQNDHACASFVHFIALEQLEILKDQLSKVNFFSMQADASTDAANKECELFMVQYLDSKATDGKLHVRDRFLAVRYLVSSTGEGLYKCFDEMLCYVGMQNSVEHKLVGFGCDGTNANIADGGLKGHLVQRFPSILVMWCLSHRVELAVKSGLKVTYFEVIDNLLLKMYYLYEHSPKKCRELKDVVESLKASFDEGEVPKGGTRPLRAHGTRFVSHKIEALNRMIDRYGAYMNHLVALTEDRTVKSSDKQKLKGYIKVWKNAKVLLGCAVFAEILKPVGILSKVLQNEEICLYQSIESVMKTKKSLEKLKATPFRQLPIVKKVINRIKEEEIEDSTCHSYQGFEIANVSSSMEYLERHFSSWIDGVTSNLRSRIKAQDIDLLSHSVTILATHGWERQESTDFGHPALEAIVSKFEIPLTKVSGFEEDKVTEEWDNMVEYARQYLNLTDNYKVIWWKLFNAPVASGWKNVLVLVELLYCFPVANGTLERVFSQLKQIKDDFRCSLNESTLDELLRIAVDAPPLSNWHAEGALDLWYKEKARRIDHKEKHKRMPKSSNDNDSNDEDDESNTTELDFDDWETWMQSDVEELEVDDEELLNLDDWNTDDNHD